MTVIRFGDVTIDVDTREIRRAGSTVDVQPQVFDVLLHLVEQRHRAVTKEELLDAVWKHRFVTESALTSRIKSARQAIGDNGRDQRMIKTMHGHGYRFVAEVDDGDDDVIAAIHAPASSPETVRLPTQPTPFVGREFELALVTKILADPSARLLTVLGPGGMGKTRLAVAAAERCAAGFEDGVFFVPLAPVASSIRVPEVIAEVVGLPLDARRDPVEQLQAYLARRRVLLVLDNVEHLLPLEALTALLDGAPGLRVLATSRERLGLRTEHVFELGGMGWSSAGADRGGAVELFIRASRSAKADLELDDAALDPVRRICRMVGGMPLAIELAAGWSDVLSPDGIVAEIERGLDVLETDLRDVPERHRSIRSVFASSWQRLSDEERDVFMRLSVFRGGCSRADAVAVAGATLPTLRRLAATSMISIASGDRYSIHELLRQFGEDELSRAGLLVDARRRHSDHFLGRLAERAGDPTGHRRLDAIRELAVDLDNIRAAWSDAVASGRLEAVERAVEALWLVFDTRGNVGAMGSMIDEALLSTAVGASPSPLLGAAHGIAIAERGDLEAARTSLEGAVEHLDGAAAAGERNAALAHLWLGWVDFLLARNGEARSHGERSRALFEQFGDRWGVARCQFLLGNVETALGRLIDAQPLLDAACATADEIGDVRGASLARRNLAILAGWFGELDRARALLDEVLSACAESGDRLGHAYALRERGKVETALGCAAEAVATLRESIAATDALENRWESAVTEDDLGNALVELGDLEAAEVSLRRCLAAAVATGNRYYVARCMGDLGALAARRGDTAEAERLLQEARSMWEALGHEPYLSWVLVQLARVSASQPDGRERAATLYRSALALAVEHGLAPFALEIVVGTVELTDAPSTEQATWLRETVADRAVTAALRERAVALLAGHDMAAAPMEQRPRRSWRETAEDCLRHLDGHLVPGPK